MSLHNPKSKYFPIREYSDIPTIMLRIPLHLYEHVKTDSTYIQVCQLTIYYVRAKYARTT